MSSWKEEQFSPDNPLREIGGLRAGAGGNYQQESSMSDGFAKRRSTGGDDAGSYSDTTALLGNNSSSSNNNNEKTSSHRANNVDRQEESGVLTINHNHRHEIVDDNSSWRQQAVLKWQTFKASLTRENLILLGYVIAVIFIGTGNRVTFKLMQYSTINYGYFISQLTTFIYVPINFAVIGLKLLFTNDITPDQRDFPWYKFLVMGALDSMQGLLIVVGGLYV
jgi:CRT-like, chloroquine-resistance transporter-like